jgi:hypothetical protein
MYDGSSNHHPDTTNHGRSWGATMKTLNAFLREVRLLIGALPMAAYGITTLWEHFGH